MWQRIQTVFLVLAIVSLAGAILLPIWGVQEGDKTYQLYALNYMVNDNGVRSHQYFPYVTTGILFVAALTVAVVQIRRYKNRLLQIKLGALNSLLIVAGYGAAVYFGSAMVNSHGGVYGLGIWLPAAAVLFNWLALRFIRRDEKIVRDSDRLR
jgi:lipopolysaccharide export LptBFGC system permease protein LptF